MKIYPTNSKFYNKENPFDVVEGNISTLKFYLAEFKKYHPEWKSISICINGVEYEYI